jgi:hypothetical protein
MHDPDTCDKSARSAPGRLWRRRLIAPGSGDPARAICSTPIAQALQAVRDPILPIVEALPADDTRYAGCVREIMHVRHQCLFVPCDFDLSPYFEIVEPTLPAGFDLHRLAWSPGEAAAA